MCMLASRTEIPDLVREQAPSTPESHARVVQGTSAASAQSHYLVRGVDDASLRRGNSGTRSGPISLLERALRDLFRHAYRATHGDDWLEKVTTIEQREKWSERAKSEGHRTKKGIVGVPSSGLVYSEFYELLEIANGNWEPISAALGKKAATMPLLELFERLRNPVGHNRQLFAYEQDLYSASRALSETR